MFERYTEKARRVIFFARYEASHYGSPYIETEHLLLGILREQRPIQLSLLTAQAIRNQIDAATFQRPSTSTSVDIPLSNESKRVLAYAAEEAERLAHRHIGTEHLLLGLLRERGCFAAQILHEHNLDLDGLRAQFGKPLLPVRPGIAWGSPIHRARLEPLHAQSDTVEIHGDSWHIDYVRDAVGKLRARSFHWHQQDWKFRDVAIHDTNSRVSFDLSLAVQPSNFRIEKGGWKSDHCFICRWELTESAESEHSVGYTNGRDWVCSECHDKFIANPNFFSSNYPEMT